MWKFEKKTIVVFSNMVHVRSCEAASRRAGRSHFATKIVQQIKSQYVVIEVQRHGPIQCEIATQTENIYHDIDVQTDGPAEKKEWNYAEQKQEEETGVHKRKSEEEFAECQESPVEKKKKKKERRRKKRQEKDKACGSQDHPLEIQKETGDDILTDEEELSDPEWWTRLNDLGAESARVDQA